MHRFLAMRYAPTQPAPWIVAEARDRLGEAFSVGVDVWGFTLCHRADGCDASPIVLPRDHGMIFGSVFTQAGDRIAEADFDERLAFELARSNGENLVNQYWGDYVAFLRLPARGLVNVVRDPSGARPLFLTQRGGLWVLCSHLDDLARAFGPLQPNWTYVRGFLNDAHLVTAATGVEGVEEIVAGECVTFEKEEMRRRSLWRPEPRAHAPIATFGDARRAIRESVETSIGAWGRAGTRILHRLSGGLDSSIVLACLRRGASASAIVCATESAVEAPESDERSYARAVATAFDTELIELHVSARDAQLHRLFSAPFTARPNLALVSYVNPFLVEAARQWGADTVTSGEGGDQLFQRSPGPYGVADAMIAGSDSREILAAALDAAHLTGASVWSILGFALRHGWARRSFDIRRTRLLTPASGVLSGPRIESDHPWMTDADDAGPGRAMQIWRLLDALAHAAPAEALNHFRCPLVLCSQPILETCLRVAPHLFCHGGEDRALWRAAFADVLPATVLNRRTKGGATRYFVSLLEANRSFLAERLIDGALVKEGIVGRVRVEQVLGKRLWSAPEKHLLLSLLCCEAWLSHFSEGREAGAV